MDLENEWGEFTADFRARFPTDAAWLSNRPETRKKWWTTFSKLRLQDALAVSAGVMEGSIEGWKRYEDIPKVYRRECGRLRSREEDRQYRERVRSQDQQSIAERLDTLEARGAPRFRCLRCEDTMYVSIWKPETVQAAARAAKADLFGEPDIRWAVCAIACTCEKAMRLNAKTRFGEHDWHIPVKDADSKARAAMYVPGGSQ